MLQQKSLKKLSLLTFNTLGTPFFAPDITKRYNAIAKLINEGNYDIICLQELFTYYHFFLFKKKLTNYSYTMIQSNPFGPKGGLAIFSKLPLSDPDFTTYSLPPHAQIPPHTRLAQNGMLSCFVKPLGIRIATTHLTSDIVHDLSPKDKYYTLIRSQSQEAAEAVKRYTENNKSIILTGDFNIAKDSSLYLEFLQTSKLHDVFQDTNQPTYLPDRLSYLYPASAPARIDYIFISSQTKFKPLVKEHIFKEQTTLLNNKKSYLSDHIGLHCILDISD